MHISFAEHVPVYSASWTNVHINTAYDTRKNKKYLMNPLKTYCFIHKLFKKSFKNPPDEYVTVSDYQSWIYLKSERENWNNALQSYSGTIKKRFHPHLGLY